MSIPKIIFQTYKHKKLPWLAQWHIWRLRRRNPEYLYEFFDDRDIEQFFSEEFPVEYLQAYQQLNIGAAKADFFRYAILYKRGGVYLDIDSLIPAKIDQFIQPKDTAVIALESHGHCYIQYALFFEAGHPFLAKTLAFVLDNIQHNRYPGNVHLMTGPSAFTAAIKSSLEQDPSLHYREMGADYAGNVRFSYPMSKLVLYGLFRRGHWKKQQHTQSVLK